MILAWANVDSMMNQSRVCVAKVARLGGTGGEQNAGKRGLDEVAVGGLNGETGKLGSRGMADRRAL